MATEQAKVFLEKLKEPIFRAAFEAAAPEQRSLLLAQAGLGISLAEAQALLREVTGELSEEELDQAAGGGSEVIRWPDQPDN